MAWQEVYTVLHTHTEDLAMVKALITFLTGAVLLTGCNAGMNGYMQGGPMASGHDRTFSVPTRGNDPSLAWDTASRECSRHGLFPKLLRTEPGRLVFECVSERADRP